MRRALARLVAAALGFGALNGVALPPGGSAVQLVSMVTVSSAKVSLSDLLPPEASAELRSAGSEVSLGGAPEPGSVRQITRAEIESALADKAGILEAIAAPDHITVQRASRRLSTAQIMTVIASILGPGQSAEGLGPGVLLQTPVFYTGDDPGLQITQVEFDALHEITRLRIWTSKEPENLPFYVTVRGRPQADIQLLDRKNAAHHAAADRPGSNGSSDDRIAAPASVKHRPPQLVKNGVETQLIIEGPDYRISSTVVPLQSGALGDQVRARDPVTRKVVTAQVVAPGVLKGTL